MIPFYQRERSRTPATWERRPSQRDYNGRGRGIPAQEKPSSRRLYLWHGIRNIGPFTPADAGGYFGDGFSRETVSAVRLAGKLETDHIKPITQGGASGTPGTFKPFAASVTWKKPEKNTLNATP